MLLVLLWLCSGTKELTGHVRSNTLSTSKEIKALIWQVGELRSGSTDSSGTVSSNKGSLLYLISEDLKTSTQSVLDAMATSVKALKETVEAGVNPEKSLKRNPAIYYGSCAECWDQRKESKTWRHHPTPFFNLPSLKKRINWNYPPSTQAEWLKKVCMDPVLEA